MSVCSICQNDQAQVICIQTECIKKKDNKMSCFECFCKHLDQFKGHKPYKLAQLIELAKENKKNLIKILEEIITKNKQDFENVVNFLDDQKQTFIKWHDQQQKKVEVFFQTQNMSLSQQIKQAQSLQMGEENYNLDSILKYCILKINESQIQYQKEKEQSTCIRQLQLDDIKNTIKFITDLSLSQSNFQFLGIVETSQIDQPKFEQTSKIQIEICEEQQKQKKNYICQECIKNNQTCTLLCINCHQKEYEQHVSNNSVKKLKVVLKEQQEISNQMFDQQEKIKEKIQLKVQQIIKNIQQQQQEEMQIFEKKKKEIYELEIKQIGQLNNMIKFNQINHNIYINLLNKSTQIIKSEFSSQEKIFMDELQQIKESIDPKNQNNNQIIALFSALKNIYINLKLQFELLNKKVKSRRNFKNNQLIHLFSNFYKVLKKIFRTCFFKQNQEMKHQKNQQFYF